MKQKHKLTSQEQQQVSEVREQRTEVREFAKPEELLRFDAEQTVVPPSVTQRLDESIQNEARPARSMWRRILGR